MNEYEIGKKYLGKIRQYRKNIAIKLWKDAKLEKTLLNPRGERKFIVTLYEENTEFEACLMMLADISRQFNVESVT